MLTFAEIVILQLSDMVVREGNEEVRTPSTHQVAIGAFLGAILLQKGKLGGVVRGRFILYEMMRHKTELDWEVMSQLLNAPSVYFGII